MAVKTAKEVLIWRQYYKCLLNVRYYELKEDKLFVESWAKLRDEYQALRGKENEADDKVLDKLHLEMWSLERKEDAPNMELLKKAQGDINEQLFGKRSYDEIINKPL